MFSRSSTGPASTFASYALTAFIAMAVFSACQEQPVALLPAEGLPGPIAMPIAITKIAVSYDKSLFFVGTEKELSASMTGASGLQLFGRPVAWKSSNEAVAVIASSGAATARVSATGEGTAIITASAEGVTGSVTLSVDAIRGDAGTLGIESFSIAEVQYDSAPGRWYYAPLASITVPSASIGGEILSVRITIPDLGTIECRTLRTVAPGTKVELFREVYGDFELVIHHADGRRIPPAVASIEVLVREGGKLSRLSASANVSPGSFPTSYTGGKVENPWDCS